MKNLIKDIAANSKTHGSMPFWSWNDKLSPDELRRQIGNMHNLGMNGFFMHARTGLETEYMSDEWFECIDACIDEAKKLGMEAWSYDENGWPSGFAGGRLLRDPKNFAAYLRYTVEDTFPAEGDILGVYVIENGKSQKISSSIGAAKYHVIYRAYDRSYVDTLDGAVIKKFIDDTYDEYRKRTGDDFGKAMPGFFTDEPQYFRWATPWSDTLPSLFSERYGYDIFSALAALYTDFDSSFDSVGADEFRYDYYRLIHELFINNYMKQIYDWCEAHGAQVTGHAVEETFLGGQMWSCGGVMPFYQYEHIPGMDYLGRGMANDLAPKQLGSVCAQIGRKKVISEMFACCGWDVSPLELKRIAELQYSGGVNMMCQHLYPYSVRGQRKRDYPAFYSEHSPWQFALRDFDNFYNNLGYTLSLGTENANTLIIHPMHSAYVKYKHALDRASITELEDKLNAIVAQFSENQIPYHFGDEWMMSNIASVDGAKLKVGLCTYEYVVVPYCLTLDSSTIALLEEYTANGGKLYLFDGVPERVDGRKADLSRFESNITFEDIKAAAGVCLTQDGVNVPSLRVQVRNTEYGKIIYIANITPNEVKNVCVNISGVKNICILDMNNLEKKAVCGKNVCGGVCVTLDFEESQSYVLVENGDIPMCGNCGSRSDAAAIVLKNNFKFVTRPTNSFTLDNAAYSTDGINFSEVLPIVCIKDMLLKQRYEGNLTLHFAFDIEKMPEGLNLAAEPMKYSKLTVNGTDISLTGKPWLDRSFKSADILSASKIGHNEITMTFSYFQRAEVYDVLYGGVTESLRNCLSFDTEIESIYLFGAFALSTDKSRFTPSDRSSICYDGDFAITVQKDEIDAGNIVTDGYPFYGGAVEIETSYNYLAGNASLLSLSGRFALCDVTVNGKFVTRMMFTHTAELSEYLHEGENKIALTLYNSNRNLLGPHHRHDPEPYGVGPNTFSFEGEWNDFKCPSYVPRYAFVRFGINI